MVILPPAGIRYALPIYMTLSLTSDTNYAGTSLQSKPISPPFVDSSGDEDKVTRKSAKSSKVGGTSAAKKTKRTSKVSGEVRPSINLISSSFN